MFESRSGVNFQTNQGYTDHAFPPMNNITAIHSVIWYDHYDFNLDGIADRVYQYESEIPGGSAFSRVQGKVTGMKTWILNPEEDMPDSMLTVTFYDSRGREVQNFRSKSFEWL